MSKTIVPPIKSQGIKTKLVPWIKSIIPNHNGRWIEPFLGTGVVAFNLAGKRAILNDSNLHIINFYKGIQEGTINHLTVKEYLIEEGDKLRVAGDEGYDHFRLIRDRFNSDFASLDLLFLSRAGFNGMMRFNKKGKWNIPFCKKPNRFAQSYVTKIVNQVKNVSEKITKDWEFSIGDFEETINRAKEDDFIYCDPPYYGRYVDYYNGWSEEDEERLFNALDRTPAKFVLSTWHHNDYRANEMIKRFWDKFTLQQRDHFYHSGGKLENRKSDVEAMVFNYVPDYTQVDEEPNLVKELPFSEYA